MNLPPSAWPLWITLALAAVYFVKQWCWPAAATRKHDQLRHDWLQAVSATAGTEILGVQTIRNSLMSCTMTATTATLAFMGGISLLYGNWAQGLTAVHKEVFLQHVLAVLVLLGLAFITSMLAARLWHHAGFVAGMPTGSPARQHWLPQGQLFLRKAGHFYALSVRFLMWCVPVAMVGVFAWAGLIAAVFLMLVLWQGIDR